MGTIDDYLATCTPTVAEHIAAAYAVAREVAPDAEQGLAYAMPCLVRDGKGIISVMQTKKHIGVYPYSGKVVTAVGPVEGAIAATKGSIHFALDAPIPSSAIRALVRARLDELDGA